MKAHHSLKLGAVAQVLPIVFGYGAIFIATPFVVTRLGLSDFGLWALTGVVAQYGVLLDFGISRGVVRFVTVYHTKNDAGSARAVVGVSVVVISIVGILLLFATLLFARQLGSLLGIGDAEIARILFVASVLILVTGMLGVVFSGASIGRGRVVAASLGLAIQRASVVFGGVVALLITPTLGSFAYGSAIGGLAGLFFVLAAIYLDEREFGWGSPRISTARELLGFGLKGQALSICDIVMNTSGKLILGLAIGPAAAGAYELGSRLALGARSFGASTATVLTAHLTREHMSNNGENPHQNYRRLVQRNAATGIFALFLLISISFSLVPAWLGAPNDEVVLVSIALAFSFALSISTGVTTATSIAVNRLGMLAVSAVAVTAVTVVLQVVLVRTLGLIGVLIGITVGSIAGVVIGVVVAHRLNRIPLADFFRPVAGPLALGVASGAIGLVLGSFWNPVGRTSSVLPLLVSASVYFSIYLTIGWALGYLPAVPVLSKGSRRRQT